MDVLKSRLLNSLRVSPCTELIVNGSTAMDIMIFFNVLMIAWGFLGLYALDKLDGSLEIAPSLWLMIVITGVLSLLYHCTSCLLLYLANFLGESNGN